MTEPKWTGPIEDWRIDWATYGGPHIRYPAWPHPESGHTIATLHFADPTPFEEKRKRASLIAAAPDLCAALVALADQHEATIAGEGFDREHCDCPALNAARAALTKARGEP